MTGLKHTMGAIPGGSVRRTFGTAYWDGSEWFANVGGNLLTARWADPMQPMQGGNIVVDISTDDYGQSSAFVVSGYTDQPRPSTGTVTNVLAAGAGTQIVFTGEDGVSYSTHRFIGSYNLGDAVYVTWDAAQPTLIGAVPTVTVTPAAAAPAPSMAAVQARGETTSTATASDTYGVGGWGRWASSQNGGEDVYTGTWGGYTVTGSWFYGAPKPELAGKTITRIRFKVPARIAAGASGAAASIHFYTHPSGARPSGDVARTVGPHDVTIPAGWGGGLIDLPLTFAAALVAGGGISIAGGPYAGFKSRLADPESGKLILDWEQ